jgi:hypothetical protein
MLLVKFEFLFIFNLEKLYLSEFWSEMNILEYILHWSWLWFIGICWYCIEWGGLLHVWYHGWFVRFRQTHLDTKLAIRWQKDDFFIHWNWEDLVNNDHIVIPRVWSSGKMTSLGLEISGFKLASVLSREVNVNPFVGTLWGLRSSLFWTDVPSPHRKFISSTKVTNDHIATVSFFDHCFDFR